MCLALPAWLKACHAGSHPTQELVPEQDLAPAGGARRKAGNGGINRQHKQGGEEYLAQVGALAVPEHARQRQRGASGALGQVGIAPLLSLILFCCRVLTCPLLLIPALPLPTAVLLWLSLALTTPLQAPHVAAWLPPLCRHGTCWR